MIGFFLYSTVVQSGANATYTIVDVKFGRVMHVELRSGTKEIVVQPVVYSGAGIRLDPGAPRSGDIGRLVLAR